MTQSQQFDLSSLVAGLRMTAQGCCAELAAVELLIAHRFWLTRADFRDRLIHTDTTPPGTDEPIPAWVNWTGAATALKFGRLACSSGEAAVLHIAGALATGGSLPASALTSLDRDNLARVLTATVRAGGYTKAHVEIR
ncbi:hypothetical protein GCM10022254_03140 [Actinomadura meridiana]|uniref:DUF222 domain-containing protein n=1 Tax=Actinomadura meridiana TaxID=559626 RepID=A0ABP8BS34_9ACTN